MPTWDLKDYRRVGFEALRKSGYHVIAMEDYVATDKRPVDKCLMVEKVDIYVGQVAFRVDAYTGDGDKGKQVDRLRQYLLREKLASAFFTAARTRHPRACGGD